MVTAKLDTPLVLKSNTPRIDYRDRLKAGPFDLIIADIPWQYEAGVTHPKQRELVTYDTIGDYVTLFTHFAGALKRNRNLWVWSDAYTLPKLMSAAEHVGFTFQALCTVKRVALGLGKVVRHQVYYLPLWSKEKPYKNQSAWLSEYLGEYRVIRSHKPQAVYDAIIAHSLPPGGTWIDPFPATHTEVFRGPQGTTILKPCLFGNTDQEAG